ncbi:MAG: hypothetical protein M3410_08620 [Acidobacteriota bacterium]|nr:hypothetical protein [Acidobacteriota bacterium]
MRRTLTNQGRMINPLAELFMLASLTAALTPFGLMLSSASVRAQDQVLRITANFSAQEAIAPGTQLELRTTRSLLPGEGRLAVFIGSMDVTALCVKDDSGFTYTPRAVPLPLGESSVIVYLVSQKDEWTELARLSLLVEELKPAAPGAEGNRSGTPGSDIDSLTETTTRKNEGAKQFQFIPSVSVNVKAQSVALFFPESSRPDRINFTDVAVQMSMQGNYSRGPLAMQNQFDLAGSSVQNEALRFGQLGNNAMQLDLSSYLMQYRFHKAKLAIGNVSFGSNRHLINSFSSRGLSLTVPITKRFDVSAAAMNGTSIVGFNNFFGVTQSKHQVLSGALGIELLTDRPGGLRVEVGALHGSLLPRSSFNQGNVTDAERSLGGSIRVVASDKAQRFRFDGGFARSRFTNPADPLLYQGRNVVPVVAVTRNARYLDVSYDLLRGFKLSESRPVNLTVAYRHEQVAPLYRSVAASSQADRLNNQWDINGGVGQVTLAFSHTRSNDNLAGIRSILQTLTRRRAFNFAAPASLFWGNAEKPSVWLPRLSYSFDRVHQFAAFVPINGDFFSPSQIPDLIATNQTFGAEWQLPRSLRLGYRFNHSFQDSRQLGRERGDLQNMVNGVSFGFSPHKALDLSFDVNADRSSNFEQNTLDNTLRFGTGLTWRLSKTMAWAMNVSTTGAGNRANTSSRRDADFDIQYSWRFLTIEKSRFRKTQGQFFIRYANRYASASDRIFGFNTFTKLQTFNAGLSFTFF